MQKWLIVSESGDRVGLWTKGVNLYVGGKNRVQSVMDRVLDAVPADRAKAESAWESEQVQRNKRRWSREFADEQAAEAAAAVTAETLGRLPGVLVSEVKKLGSVIA